MAQAERRLPDLYREVAKVLNLAPEQHAEAAIKSILGSVMNVVNGLGTLRNKLSDAHGRGGKIPVRPSPRHAAFAVNMASTVATFLVDTYNERTATAGGSSLATFGMSAVGRGVD